MKQDNEFETIREYLDKIRNISNKFAFDITEIDLAKLNGYANVIWTVIDVIENEMKMKEV
jgi:hypothetical protein